jgi:NhaP-type Na+/H+ or K+/H+ antiporter
MGAVAIFILLVFLFTLVSKRIEKTILTAPIIFTLAGISAYLAFPGLAEREIHHEIILTMAELTLAILLFTDASRMDARKLLKQNEFPLRLLVIGMPFTIIAGTITAFLLFDEFSIWEAALLAVILAPTDASLGQVIVNSHLVPERIRQALNVEAGLNDGLSMPFFTLFLGFAAAASPFGGGDWLLFTAEQILFGVLVGIIIGWSGGWLLGQAGKHDWIETPLLQLGLLALALMCYGAADMINGNGFIAAFVGGLVIRRGFKDAHFHASRFSEAWGELLNFYVFFIFGTLVVPLIPHFEMVTLIFAVLSLTIVRMLPVALAMVRSRLKPASVLFMGWFGPRGLASIVLGLIYLEQEAQILNEEAIILAVAATVLISIFVHGASALPGTKWYAKQVANLDDSVPELEQVASLEQG